MNLVDIGLVLLLGLCALRGLWRGLIREVFGFAAFVVGLIAALRLTDQVAANLATWELTASLPDVGRSGVAFVVVFLAVSGALNLLGFAFDRLLGDGPVRQLGRIGGGVFGTLKGAAVLSFVLLFFHLFPFVRVLERQMVDSRLARPLVSAADTVLRREWRQRGVGESS